MDRPPVNGSLTMRIVRGPDGEVRHVPTPFVASVGAGKGRKKRIPPDPIKAGSDSAAQQLKLFVERIERLEEERQAFTDDIRDVYAEAKSLGFDRKGLSAIVLLRKKEKHVRDEDDAILETYRIALGMD